MHHKWQSYGTWFLIYLMQQTDLVIILDWFLSFYPPNNSKNQNFENLKKTPEDIIILHMCVINNNHMMYDSWEIVHDGQIFLSFWMIFCPLTPLTTPKIKSLKNWKKHQEILPFCHCFFFLFFFRFTPLTAQKIKISQNWKKNRAILSCYTCVPKIMIRWCTAPEIWCKTY